MTEQLRKANEELEAEVERRTGELAGANEELRLANAALQESRERFRTLVERTSDWIWEVDQNGVYTYVSPRVKDLLGYEPEEIIGKTPFDLMPPDEAERVRDEFGIIVASREPFERLENVNLRKDGQLVALETSGIPLLSENGELRGYRGIDRDITQRKRAEEELKQTLSELWHSNQELENFARFVSHDLREPLRTVANYAGLLERRYGSRLDRYARDFIGHMVDGAQRMQSLIDGLRSYSRVGTGQKELTPTDCEPALEKAIKNLDAAIAESGAVVTHDPLPTVMGDEALLTQLFQNLIGNAIKFRGAAPPEIQVSATPIDQAWIADHHSRLPSAPGSVSADRGSQRYAFCVRDNGIGIEPDQAERIFMIFQRLDTQDEHGGTGVGLALCKKIVEHHQGHIWVESEPGKGSCFYFTIPSSQGFGGHADA